MGRQLLIMRHAKSAWDTDAATDFERPLAKRGQRDVPLIGGWLREQNINPDYVVSSPAERALQTVIGVCKILGIKKRKINWDTRIYGADIEELLEVLSDVPRKTQTVLLVGHNPGLEFLVSHLTNNAGMEGMDVGIVKTATTVYMEISEEWDAIKSGCATLIEIKSPRELYP